MMSNMNQLIEFLIYRVLQLTDLKQFDETTFWHLKNLERL